MKLSTILSLLILFLSANCFSQENTKWGVVSNFEKNYTKYEKDTSMRGVILFATCKLDFVEDMNEYEHIEFSYHFRKKILRQSGKSLGNFKIWYISKDDNQEILDLEAQVIQPSGEIIKLSSKDFLINKENDDYSSYSCAFPNLEVGSIIEYRYILKDQYLFSSKGWYFQNDLPTLYSKFEYGRAIYYSYKSLFFPGFEMHEKKYANMETSASLDTTSHVYYKDDFTITVKGRKYIARNAPPIYGEDYMTSINDYRAKIFLQLESYQYPGQERHEEISTWSNLGQHLKTHKKFGHIFNKKKVIKHIALKIAPKIHDDYTTDKKIEILYNFVNDNIYWDNKYEVVFSDNSPTKVFENALGSSGDINLIFLGLCHYFDIDAKAVLISTRSNGRLSTKTPILSQFNHVLILTKYEGVDKLIDLGQKHRPIGTIAKNSINNIGWVVGEEKEPIWVPLKGGPSARKQITNIVLNADGLLDIKMRTKEMGYFATGFKNNVENSSLSAEEYVKSLYENTEIESCTFKNYNDNNKPLVTTIHITNEDFIDLSNIALNPYLDKVFTNAPFKNENRFFPIDFSYPFTIDNTISILIDPSYNIVSIPEDLKNSFSDNSCGFNYTIIKKGNNIQIRSIFNLKRLHYSTEEYQQLKTIFHEYIDKTKEEIILEKKAN